MSTPSALQELWEIREPLPSKRLDEAVWQAWLEKGHAGDRRNSAVRLTAIKWVSLTGLLVMSGLWTHLAPYDVVARFIVAAGAIVVMFHAFHTGHHVLAAALAAVALLYNPVVPVFSFSGDWPRALVVASAVPFVASLTAPIVRKERDA